MFVQKKYNFKLIIFQVMTLCEEQTNPEGPSRQATFHSLRISVQVCCSFSSLFILLQPFLFLDSQFEFPGLVPIWEYISSACMSRVTSSVTAWTNYIIIISFHQLLSLDQMESLFTGHLSETTASYTPRAFIQWITPMTPLLVLQYNGRIWF